MSYKTSNKVNQLVHNNNILREDIEHYKTFIEGYLHTIKLFEQAISDNTAEIARLHKKEHGAQIKGCSLKDFLLEKGFNLEDEGDEFIRFIGLSPKVRVQLDVEAATISANFNCLFSDDYKQPIEECADISPGVLWEGICRLHEYGVDWVNEWGKLSLVGARWEARQIYGR